MDESEHHSRKSSLSSRRTSRSVSHCEDEIIEENPIRKSYSFKFNLPPNFVPTLKPKRTFCSSKTIRLFSLDNDTSFSNQSDEDVGSYSPLQFSKPKEIKPKTDERIRKERLPCSLKVLNQLRESKPKKSLFFNNNIKVSDITKKENDNEHKMEDNGKNDNSFDSHDL